MIDTMEGDTVCDGNEGHVWNEQSIDEQFSMCELDEKEMYRRMIHANGHGVADPRCKACK